MASSKSSGNSSSGSDSGSASTTRDHQKIRKWVEERGGRPACVKGTGSEGDCLLRIDYPGQGDDSKLEPIEWEEFFEKFDEENLEFLYQETKDGNMSRFSKFVRSGGGHKGEK